MFDCVWTVCIISIGLKWPSRLKLNQTSRNKTCILVLANRSKQTEYSQINKVHFSSFYPFLFLNERHTYLNRRSICYSKVKLTKVKGGQLHGRSENQKCGKYVYTCSQFINSIPFLLQQHRLYTWPKRTVSICESQEVNNHKQSSYFSHAVTVKCEEGNQ